MCSEAFWSPDEMAKKAAIDTSCSSRKDAEATAEQ